MSADRERAVTEAFVSLTNNLVGDFDVVELLTGLTVDCAKLLDVAAAGLLLADARGVLHVGAASSEATRDLELLQLQRDDGPCLECYRSGAPVGAPDLRAAEQRWPQFVPAALAAGFQSVHAMPMRLQDHVLGALGLFGANVGSLNDDDLELGQALAHVASVAIMTGNAAANREVITQQLQIALNSRVVLEQAKGVIAQVSGLDMDEAFLRMRDFARSQHRRLTEVARSVVSRELSAEEILERKLSSGRRGTVGETSDT